MDRNDLKKLLLPALFLLAVLTAVELYINGGVTQSMVISLICDELTAYITYYFFIYRKGRGTTAIWVNYVLWTAFWTFSNLGNFYGWYK